MNNHPKIRLETEPATDNKKKALKFYHPPQLEDLGDLRTQTLGGSPGPIDDSGPDLLNTHPIGM
jgi:hypothetical protein